MSSGEEDNSSMGMCLHATEGLNLYRFEEVAGDVIQSADEGMASATKAVPSTVSALLGAPRRVHEATYTV